MTQIIGIGGCSRSGKSSLAQKIKDLLPSKQLLLLDMDDFVLPESQIPKINDRVDWERPESVDFERIIHTIKNRIADHDVVVVEGILVFANDELLKLLDKTVWMQISKETFLERRKKETRWGNEPDWFIEHVWESYLRYGQFPDADIVLSGKKATSNEEISRILK